MWTVCLRKHQIAFQYIIHLPTTREGNVFTGVCYSDHNRPHGYSVTALPSYSAVGTHPTGMLSCF